MSPREITEAVRADVPLLGEDDTIASAVKVVLDSGLPALPVVGADGRLRGIFGEREFMNAIFPGYVNTLRYAGFIPKPIEDVLEKRREAAGEPVGKYMNTEHVDVFTDASDTQIAETFLHHRVLIVPVTEDHRVVGVITRSAFFRALAERFRAAVDP